MKWKHGSQNSRLCVAEHELLIGVEGEYFAGDAIDIYDGYYRKVSIPFCAYYGDVYRFEGYVRVYRLNYAYLWAILNYITWVSLFRIRAQ